MKTVRTRFAPSPTGYLHIGGARTALFNWLFARHHNGVFVLRIEDTDAVRSTQEAIQAILDGMKWMGLDWDEGPFYQTQRYDLYREYAQKLLDEGKAYKCYCTQEELDAKRKQAAEDGKPFSGYDRTCRERADQPDKPFVLRFKAPLEGTTVVHDLVQGDVHFPNAELDDLVILRTSGSPTYNFCVVIDDATMEISHVIRGNDHLSNTPKQILMYEALGCPVPEFAHLPLILGEDKSKLSKRHAAVSVLTYRDEGYLPEALVNFLVRLGWSHGDQEIFSLEDMIEHFNLDEVGKSAGVFNTEKLLWLSQHYIKEANTERIGKLLLPFLQERYAEVTNPVSGEEITIDSAWLHKVVQLQQERSKTLGEMADAIGYYFVEELEYDPKAAKKNLRPVAADLMEKLVPHLEKLEQFDQSTLEACFKTFIEEQEIKLVKIAQPVRVAITGGSASPGLYDVMTMLGKNLVIQRINRAIHWIRTER